MKKTVVLIYSLIFSIQGYTQAFKADTLTIGISPVLTSPVLKWGDYDDDRDYDLFFSGVDTAGKATTGLLQNSGNLNFTLAQTALIALSSGNAAWCDLDNDNDLDLAVCGLDSNGLPQTKLFTNSGNGQFSLSNIVLPGVANGNITFGDFNSDGRQDLLLSGQDVSGNAITQLYKNNGTSTFTQASAPLPGIKNGAASWADFDNDGYADLLISGLTSLNAAITEIYLNNKGQSFSKLNITLPAVFASAQDISDYDNDGDLDILLAGKTSDSTRVTKILENDNGANTFTDLPVNFIGISPGEANWSDIDNDGDPDVILAGAISDSASKLTVYLNQGQKLFTQSSNQLLGQNIESGTVADYDSDGDLDLFNAIKDTTGLVTQILTNITAPPNTPPFTPNNLVTTLSQTALAFNWPAATDAQTAPAGLSYNIRIGTAPGGTDIFSPVSSANGFHKIAALGNLGQKTSLTLPVDLVKKSPKIYWSVQAIDHAFAASPFGEEKIFTFDFTEATTALTGVNASAIDWGDFDNDSDLDLLLTGQNATNQIIARIFRNDRNSQFTEINAGLEGVASSSADWGDFNNDGFLDILITGFTPQSSATAAVYKNNGNATFTKINANLAGVFQSEADWGDFDNDGDLDILFAGLSLTNGTLTKIYRNDAGAFSDINTNLPAVSDGAVKWCDFNNDNLLDVILTGTSAGGKINKIYRNNGAGDFSETDVAFPGISSSSLALGDCDNDGDADILFAGLTTNGRVTKIYINAGNFVFVDSGAKLEGISNGDLNWGDFDNDGDLDVILSGFNNEFARVSKVCRNDGNNQFTDIAALLEGAIFGTATWADIDNDFDLDILVTGSSATQRIAKIYTNNIETPNSPPEAPGGLFSSLTQNSMTFGWNKASDNETPASGWTYNLRVGSKPGSADILSAMSASDGYRKIVQPGNTGHRTSHLLNINDIANFPSIYWSVQAVDNTFAGSAFSEEGSFNPVVLAVQDVPNDQGGKVSIRWRASSLDHDLNQLTSYSIWRILPDTENFTNNATGKIKLAKVNGQTSVWEWLATIPARRGTIYAYTALTLFDSSAATSGKQVFVVSAHTSNANIFFDSMPDSGHSVDNIAPAAPLNLAGTFTANKFTLTWNGVADRDFRNYAVFYGQRPGLNPGALQPIAVTLDTVCTGLLPDADGNVYFVVAAQDSSDNLSPASNEISFAIDSGNAATPEAFALLQNYPNPFNPATQIKFALAEDAPVKLEIYNIKGEKVATLVNGFRKAGYHVMQFDAGNLATGTYCYKIQAGGFVAIKKMILIK